MSQFWRIHSRIPIESNKGEFTVTVEGMEEISKLVDAFITSLLDNQDALLEQIDKNSSIDDETFKEFLNLYMNEIITALVRFNDEYDLGLTEADIEEAKAEAEAAVEDAVKEAGLDDVSREYKDAFADLKDNRQDVVDTLVESVDSVDGKFTMTDSLTGKEGSRVYTCGLQAAFENKDTDEDVTVNVKSVLTEDNSIVVDVPKNYTALSDIIYAALVYTYENGLLDDAFGDMVDIPGVDTGIDSSSGVDTSDVEQDYDGSVTVTDSWSDETAVIEFDKELVRVDADSSYVDSGALCFEAVDDQWCYAFMRYESGITPEDVFDYEQEYDYQDAEYYKNVEFSDMTARTLDTGVTLYEFDVNYTAGDDATNLVQDRYFIVETSNGVIHGNVNLLEELREEDALPYEQFMNAVFVNVY